MALECGFEPFFLPPKGSRMYYAKFQNVLCSFDAICTSRPDAICKVVKKKWRNYATVKHRETPDKNHFSDNSFHFSENL